jgi:transcriptional regulator with XRE-family HTH domain
MERIGLKIKNLRKELHITQKNLADILGISAQAISKWERRDNDPDINLLPEIAKTLGVTIDYLLGDGIMAPENDEVTLRISKDEVMYMIQNMDIAEKGITYEPFMILTALQNNKKVAVHLIQDERLR